MSPVPLKDCNDVPFIRIAPGLMIEPELKKFPVTETEVTFLILTCVPFFTTHCANADTELKKISTAKK